MCSHQPQCPTAEAPDREAAHTIACHPEQGWSLLCNGVLLFEDTGELLPDGQRHRPAPPHRRTSPPDRSRLPPRRPAAPAGSADVESAPAASRRSTVDRPQPAQSA